jgi:acetylornithine/N-succinyldiaminopimelate aminotransferase
MLATIAAGATKYLTLRRRSTAFRPRAVRRSCSRSGDRAGTAAILVEPIQGEGGVRTLSDEVLRGLRALCDRHGLHLILDEVQSGMGRTGRLFAHEWAGITPDVMAIAKGLGGGFPVGAFLATAEAAKGMTVGTHGSTFGGNPLAMAVADAVLDVMLAPDFCPPCGTRRCG